MLINGGLGRLRKWTENDYRYDDDREYGVEKRFTCVIKGGEVAFSGWGKTVILPIDEALAITGLLAGRAKGAHDFIGVYKGPAECEGLSLAELAGVQQKEKPKDLERIAEILKHGQMKIEFAAKITGESVETLERWLNE
jgi:hypothetical protein